MDPIDPASQASSVAFRALPSRRVGLAAAAMLLAAGGLSAGWASLEHAAAQVDLPGDAGAARRRRRARPRRPRRRHGERLDRPRLAVDRPADPPARALRRPRRPEGAADAVPARRAPLPRPQRLSHRADARARLLGAGDRLPRLRREHRRAAVGDRRRRGRRRRLALARRAPSGQRALRLRPFARRRDRGAARGAARRRAPRRRRAASSSKARSPRSATCSAPSSTAGCRSRC